MMVNKDMLTIENTKLQNQICKFLEKDTSDEEFIYINMVIKNLKKVKNNIKQRMEECDNYIDYLIDHKYQYLMIMIFKTDSMNFNLLPN